MPTVPTQGTTFLRGDGASPEVFNEVGQITAINGVGLSRSLITVTNLKSTLQEYRLAIPDGKEFTVEMQYDSADTEAQGLRDDLEAGITRNVRITLGNASPAPTVDIAVLVMDVGQEIAIDDVVKQTFTFKPTGTLTYTNG